MEKAGSNWENEITKRSESKNFYSEGELIKILKQLVNALLYFQNKGISHRNIKPKNILITEDNLYKISDLSKANLNFNEQHFTSIKENQLFMSTDENSINLNLFSNDIFSLGYCFLCAMSLDINLFENSLEENIMDDVISLIKNYNQNKRFSKKFLDLIYKMMDIHENKRYNFFDLNNDIKNF